jgi:glycosyl transferase, family 25
LQPGSILRVYVINLDRSVERWRVIAGHAVQFEIDITRIPAIDGSAVPRTQWVDFDTSGFRRINGRDALAGEYGCYMSHIAALRQFLTDGDDSALILEDDAVLNGGLTRCLTVLGDHFGHKSVLVRMVVHRKVGFETLEKIETGQGKTLNLGQCWLGPNGSAAAYWLTRAAAANVLKSALPARMPFDTFIEHSWHFGTPSLIADPSVMQIPAPPFSEIGASKDPATPAKFLWYRRSGALTFRTILLFKRLLYCAMNRRIA